MSESAETQIKVRAGQVWFSSYSDKEVILTKGDADTVTRIHENYTFVPQNDLERMAVDTPQWEWGDHCYYRHRGMVTKENHTKIFKQEWQNMRYYLGLDKKLHYELIDGKWVEQ